MKLRPRQVFPTVVPEAPERTTTKTATAPTTTSLASTTSTATTTATPTVTTTSAATETPTAMATSTATETSTSKTAEADAAKGLAGSERSDHRHLRQRKKGKTRRPCWWKQPSSALPRTLTLIESMARTIRKRRRSGRDFFVGCAGSASSRFQRNSTTLLLCTCSTSSIDRPTERYVEIPLDGRGRPIGRCRSVCSVPPIISVPATERTAHPPASCSLYVRPAHAFPDRSKGPRVVVTAAAVFVLLVASPLDPAWTKWLIVHTSDKPHISPFDDVDLFGR